MMMWVATTQRHIKDEYGNYRDVLECSYSEYFEGHEVGLVPVPNSVSSPERVFELDIRGVVLTGGDEVDPSLYGGEAREDYVVSPERDRTERLLLNEGLERNLPILGLCRGLQTVNVYFGGQLKDLNASGDSHPPGEHHEVEIKEEDAVEALDAESATVNSYHDQAVTVDTLASELEVFAVHDDVVEGLYHPRHRLAAIQWHPERDDERPIDRLLVESFRQSSLFWG